AAQHRGHVAALAHERGEVEASAERGALAAQHHRAQRSLLGEAAASVEERLEHAAIEAIVLVGPHEADLGHALGPGFLAQLHANAIVHAAWLARGAAG